jgi:HK97 family phage major capsid protein
MADLFALRAQREHALNKADSILKTAENARRELTPEESREIAMCTTAVDSLNPQIKKIEGNNTITKMFPGGQVLVDGGTFVQRNRQKVTLSPEYVEGFFAYIASKGQNVSAALYEGSSPAGGYAVPITVDDQIVPLAPQEMAVRQLAQVIPTAMDIKFPVKNSFSVATAKAETSSFTESELTLSQFTLSAFMAGVLGELSWELAQDVPAFQASVVDDMILAQQMYEENLYVNGTGSGQAQGLIGNVGSGGTYEVDSNSNLVSVNGTLSLMGTLNAVYWKNASWLMQRQTSIILRKAQAEQNLFFPAFNSVNGQDYLHGHPVQYSEYMPVAARGASPIIFGDFKRGYIIGDRGGSGINVKVLDQPLAAQGLIQLLAYRRTDGRVRRSEALQQYTIAAS